ncbi:MAG: hypothetical protein HY342_07085 [Candidatus Lambdaproteobacteria bacterium]|nr:hypothetical protein [Candidatus Lambdaproteobacteria bacterium]
MSTELFDPTVPAPQETIAYAPRPARLEGLRVGLVENTKFNSNVLLTKVGERLAERYKMKVVGMSRKQSPAHGVDEQAIKEFKTKADFVIAGIGD